MPVPVSYADEYLRVRRKLTRATRIAVEVVEDEIAREPELGHHRRRLDDGTILDYSAEDVYVIYDRSESGAVEFRRLLDLRAPDDP
jgi:hypothetical protein